MTLRQQDGQHCVLFVVSIADHRDVILVLRLIARNQKRNKMNHLNLVSVDTTDSCLSRKRLHNILKRGLLFTLVLLRLLLGYYLLIA